MRSSCSRFDISFHFVKSSFVGTSSPKSPSHLWICCSGGNLIARSLSVRCAISYWRSNSSIAVCSCSSGRPAAKKSSSAFISSCCFFRNSCCWRYAPISCSRLLCIRISSVIRFFSASIQLSDFFFSSNLSNCLWYPSKIAVFLSISSLHLLISSLIMVILPLFTLLLRV